jgi:uncharacterized membrane protein
MKSRALELVAAGIVVAAWFLAAHGVQTLPERIPTHFGLSGARDASGPASSLWLLPVAITAIYVFLNAIALIPTRLMNYPVTITDRNREGVYAVGREMLPAVKVCALLTLLAVEWSAIDAARRASLSQVFLAAIFAPVILLLALMIYYTLKMRAV